MALVGLGGNTSALASNSGLLINFGKISGDVYGLGNINGALKISLVGSVSASGDIETATGGLGSVVALDQGQTQAFLFIDGIVRKNEFYNIDGAVKATSNTDASQSVKLFIQNNTFYGTSRAICRYLRSGEFTSWSLNDVPQNKLSGVSKGLHRSTSVYINGNGSLNNGWQLTDIYSKNDGSSIVVSESSNTPGFTVEILFSDVKYFDSVAAYVYYDGTSGHNINVDIYDYSQSLWHNLGSFSDQSSFTDLSYQIQNCSDYISSSGTVLLRFNHSSTGDNTHTLSIDFVVLGDSSDTVLECDSNALGYFGATSAHQNIGGKWYWEIYIDRIGGSQEISVGVVNKDFLFNGHVGVSSASWGYIAKTGNSYHDSVLSAYGQTFTEGDVVMVALDADNHKIWFGKNGVWQNGGDPSNGINEAFNDVSGEIYAAVVFREQDDKVTANFGSGVLSFVYSPPTGFNAGFIGEPPFEYLDSNVASLGGIYSDRIFIDYSIGGDVSASGYFFDTNARPLGEAATSATASFEPALGKIFTLGLSETASICNGDGALGLSINLINGFVTSNASTLGDLGLFGAYILRSSSLASYKLGEAYLFSSSTTQLSGGTSFLVCKPSISNIKTGILDRIYTFEKQLDIAGDFKFINRDKYSGKDQKF